jgi:hypothetical protein
MNALTSSQLQTPIFAALVRTTGARHQSLQESLDSLAVQSLPCIAVVIVHGSAESYSRVKQTCAESNSPDLVHVLHAPDTDPRRMRGYPINVGLDYCLNQIPDVRYIFLLDDDDIVYPFFTSAMASAFLASEADVVYAAANCREAGKPLAAAYPLKPYYHLFDRNFIPSNSYAVRAEALRRSGVRADEDFDYNEDWLFLLRLLDCNVRFHRLDTTLSEFRSESAADFSYRHDIESWESTALRVRHYINTTSFQLPGGDLARLGSGQLPSNREDNETQEYRFADTTMTAALHRRVWELEHSFSWKCTKPVRDLAGSVLRLRSWWKSRQ